MERSSIVQGESPQASFRHSRTTAASSLGTAIAEYDYDGYTEGFQMMQDRKQVLIYLMFFFSGAAALMYQVVWVRSLSLVFGGTHMAVTTVLSIFMGGLALGGYLVGRHMDRLKKPMAAYGLMECGIGLFAVIFAGLMFVYPSIYKIFVLSDDVSPLYISIVRIIFSAVALIVPASLMGATLPVLAGCVSAGEDNTGGRLSLLYGLNTLGAVAGAATAGFYLLRFYSVSATLISAVAINLAVGVTAMILQRSVSCQNLQVEKRIRRKIQPWPEGNTTGAPVAGPDSSAPLKLVLWGIGISGFCALGYEILFTRILVIVVGGSVYGFTTMLVAFLAGIALGSKFYTPFSKALNAYVKSGNRHVFGFGLVQIIIAITALVSTYYIRFLPTKSMHLQGYLAAAGMSLVDARLLGSFIIACAYMIVPAFFMGLAFPVAVTVNTLRGKEIGRATGEVLAYNTVGAILGAAVSGFALIYFFGIERSLQMLVLINAGLGFTVLSRFAGSRIPGRVLPVLLMVVLIFLAADRQSFRMWDAKYFAIFRNNQPEAFNTPEKIREAVENTDVLFSSEGIESTISVIRTKAGNQAMLVNGKVVASSTPQDRQCQFTLGHLPMLLHPKPSKVLVVGLGTGMTLGATSVYPTVKELTLAEIEPDAVKAARTFGRYNHRVLDNPMLKIIFNDGRNFLMTTNRKFDVITADPIHPWTRGSGYLYTKEYFRTAAAHLLPGGIMCQWLPIYELSVSDLKSVIRTFGESFSYTMLWLTQSDAELVGSNTPLMPDEKEIGKRINFIPAVRKDLTQVSMGSEHDFLSYFVMGTEQLKAFGEGGVINTDDNLYLEFSTPFSAGINVMQANADAIEKYRENIFPYLAHPKNGRDTERMRKEWASDDAAAKLYGRAHALYLGQEYSGLEFQKIMEKLKTEYPGYAPARFLMNDYRAEVARTPELLQKISMTLLSVEGGPVELEISSVTSRISSEMAVIDFVDNKAKAVYGEIFVPGSDDERTKTVSAEIMSSIGQVYKREADSARSGGRPYPDADAVQRKISDTISREIEKLRQKMDED